MKNCAEYIAEAMNYMDGEIDKIDDAKLSRGRIVFL